MPNKKKFKTLQVSQEVHLLTDKVLLLTVSAQDLGGAFLLTVQYCSLSPSHAQQTCVRAGPQNITTLEMGPIF